MDNKIILIGDIVGSRELDPGRREQVQKALTAELEAINQDSSSQNAAGLASPHTITLGDEFQAVYHHMDKLWGYTWRILARLHPVKVRFSIGVGRLTTELNPDQAIGMDGPAFHAAREGIERLKRSGFLYHVSQAEPDPGPELNLVNASLHLISQEMLSWQKNRFSILHQLDAGSSIREISGRLGISETAVYKNRKDGNLDIILAIKQSITDLIPV